MQECVGSEARAVDSEVEDWRVWVVPAEEVSGSVHHKPDFTGGASKGVA